MYIKPVRTAALIPWAGISRAHSTAPKNTMQTSYSGHVLLSTADHLSQSEFAGICGLSEAEFQELLDYGVLPADQLADAQICFSRIYIEPVKTAYRKARDFDLDVCAAAIFTEYLIQIHHLRRELASLQAAA